MYVPQYNLTEVSWRRVLIENPLLVFFDGILGMHTGVLDYFGGLDVQE